MVTDYAMNVFLEMKISIIHYFYLTSMSAAKISHFLVNPVNFFLHFVTTLSPRNNNNATRKNLKKQRYTKCIFSMHYRKHFKTIDSFCEIWVLTLSFFGTPLRPHYSIFSPQIMQENWLTYCSMKNKIIYRQIRT